MEQNQEVQNSGLERQLLEAKKRRILCYRIKQTRQFPDEIVNYFFRNLGVEEASMAYIESRGGRCSEEDVGKVGQVYLALEKLCRKLGFNGSEDKTVN